MRRKAACAAAVVVASTALPFVAAASGPTKPDAAAKAASWLARQQQPGGEFFRSGYPADAVADAITALVAGSGDGARDAVERALGYLRAHAWERAQQRAAYAGRVVMALVASGQDPRSFAGHDFVARIKAFYDSVTGFYDTGSAHFSNSLAALGLLAAGETLPAEAMRAIRLGRCPDGGFSFDKSCSGTNGSDVDTTALVLCVLVAAGVPSSDGIRADARAFLLAAVNQSGGYGFYADEPTNANSTGLALAAIAALGENPEQAPWRTPGGNPRAALLALQTTSGGFRRTASFEEPDGLATVQAIPGTSGSGFPVRPRAAVLGEQQHSASPSPNAKRTAASAAAAAKQRAHPATNAPATLANAAAADLGRAAALGGSGQTTSRSVPVSLAFALLALSASALIRRLEMERRT